MSTKYDAIVIGTGQSGPFLATRLADDGMKVAIIERRFFGGTCVNAGCIPTKTMVASAYAAHLASRGSEYGVRLPGDVSVDKIFINVGARAVIPPMPGVDQFSYFPNSSILDIDYLHSRYKSVILSNAEGACRHTLYLWCPHPDAWADVGV